MVRRSLYFKIGSVCALLLLITLLEVISVWAMLRQQQADARIANLAGQLRMLSQQTAKDAMMLALNEPNAREGLELNRLAFIQTMDVLLNGSPEEGIPPASPAARAALLEMSASWQPYDQALQNMLAALPATPEMRQATAYVASRNDRLLSQADAAASVMQTEAERKVSQVLLLLYGFLVLSVFIFFGMLLLLRRLLRPLQRMTAAATRLAEGEDWRAVDLGGAAGLLRSSDEIGVMAHAFERMTNRLHQTLDTLEQRVAERTAALSQRVDDLALLNRLGRQLASVNRPDALLPEIARQIRVAFGLRGVLVLLPPGREDAPLGAGGRPAVLCPAAFSGSFVPPASPDLASDYNPLPVDDGCESFASPACLEAFYSGEAVLVVDGRRMVVHGGQPDGAIDLVLPSDQRPHRAELAVPLRVGVARTGGASDPAQVVSGQSGVLGVLNLQNTHPEVFSPHNLAVIQTLADQLAIVIRNAKLFDDIQAAREEAEQANHTKSRFLTNMSHELRTPLNAIINFAFLLGLGVEGDINPGQAEMLQRIEASGQHLLGLINDILDLSKIEAGRFELVFEPLDLADLIQITASTSVGLLGDGSAQERRVSLRTDVAANLPLVQADRTRIRQVLLNLLSNAAKFTEEGTITLRAWADEDWVMVSVQDTGIGISAEDLPRVFEEFVQLDSILQHSAAGTGLGLPISRRFVELHGGRIWAESTPGAGSAFTFALPLRLSAAAPAEVQSDSSEITN